MDGDQTAKTFDEGANSAIKSMNDTDGIHEVSHRAEPAGEKTTGTGTSAFNKDGAIGSAFKADGAIGGTADKIGGPLAQDGAIGWVSSFSPFVNPKNMRLENGPLVQSRSIERKTETRRNIYGGAYGKKRVPPPPLFSATPSFLEGRRDRLAAAPCLSPSSSEGSRRGSEAYESEVEEGKRWVEELLGEMPNVA
ncbi:uncharacterized protein PAC_00771 [Phialocephala subalpina]|uniref:Uncharacterized protein n=1 Tax=Phialocephala subalpina TaxID=576137 RepID=A0A1L7WDN9_9HELO|nr:uncharacterized protein PAC_00771 [Phialocephala subalpina]